MKNDDDEKTLFAKRLTLAMRSKGYEAKASVLEREFNLNYSGKPMTLHGVRKWLIGEAIPSGDKLLTLAKWLEVPPEELVFEKNIQRAIKERDQLWQKN
jgi:transcriptional regulator with XRE-family HTH domain